MSWLGNYHHPQHGQTIGFWTINIEELILKYFSQYYKHIKCNNVLKFLEDHQITIKIDAPEPTDLGRPFFYVWDPRCSVMENKCQMFVHKNSTTFQLIQFSKHISIKKLSDNSGRFTAPLWLPDGRIVVVAKHQSKSKLDVVVLDENGKLQQVLKTVDIPSGSVALANSRDGRYVAFSAKSRSASTELVIFDLWKNKQIVQREDFKYILAFFFVTNVKKNVTYLLYLTVDARNFENKWRVYSENEHFSMDCVVPSSAIASELK